MHLSSLRCPCGCAHCRSFKKAPKILGLDYLGVDRIRGKFGRGRPGVAMRLLLVEDNQRLRELLADSLNRAGYGVDVVGTVAEFFGGVALVPYDLGIVDLGLPDGDGLVAIRDLRSRGHGMPILVITARGSIEDRVNGLDIGADDYLIKPFNHAELLARVRALLRRPTELHGPILCKGNLELDESNGQARCAGKAVNLRLSERRLLALLMRRSGSVISKTAIEVALSEFGREMSANAVEALVSRTRKALAEAGAAIVIETFRGVGYQLREDQSQ
jgi:DNA-binding response OmpR family regulator